MFLLTEHCNARCVHCDIWNNKGQEDTPSVEQLKACLRDLRRWLGPVQVTFTGGEALLKPYTVELVQYASSLGLFVEVLTNGYWADQSIERLALTNPWRVTVSLDGIGKIHDKIRGRSDFYAKTSASIQTLCRIREQQKLGFSVLLKTVIMEHNLDDICSVAEFAADNKAEVLYQPIEQNYNAPDDPAWFQNSDNWPHNVQKVTEALRKLMALKGRGLPIANSYESLDRMVHYFAHPEELGLAVQSHVTAGCASFCSAITNLQVQANGDVKFCARRPPGGNIKEASLRAIWEHRPRYWQTDCCRTSEGS
jgi:MoaA/NifB/PqqE/SkfB family radical SAM enzyme